MNDPKPRAHPWHPADEKKPARKGAPLGTHSLTGGGANVGMPTADAGEPERSAPHDQVEKAEADLLAEPRARRGDLLGRK